MKRLFVIGITLGAAGIITVATLFVMGIVRSQARHARMGDLHYSIAQLDDEVERFLNLCHHLERSEVTPVGNLELFIVGKEEFRKYLPLLRTFDIVAMAESNTNALAVMAWEKNAGVTWLYIADQLIKIPHRINAHEYSDALRERGKGTVVVDYTFMNEGRK